MHSAGGLEAFENFFRHTSADAGIAFAVVQHLAPDHASALPELLARYTSMGVEQARDRTKVVPNRVYIIPPNATLTIKNGTLRVASPTEPRGHRMPIDSLFGSLAEDRDEYAVCILLSGTGTDGTVGLRAIKEYSGMAMAQTLESAQYDAILRSAIATGLVDHVLPVEEMPAKLREYAAHLNLTNGKPESGWRKGSHWQVTSGAKLNRKGTLDAHTSTAVRKIVQGPQCCTAAVDAVISGGRAIPPHSRFSPRTGSATISRRDWCA